MFIIIIIEIGILPYFQNIKIHKLYDMFNQLTI